MKTAALDTQAALKAAKVPDDLANKAAAEIGEIATELKIQRWILGSQIGLSLLILTVLLRVLEKL